jgi:hypothetical protein
MSKLITTLQDEAQTTLVFLGKEGSAEIMTREKSWYETARRVCIFHDNIPAICTALLTIYAEEKAKRLEASDDE